MTTCHPSYARYILTCFENKNGVIVPFNYDRVVGSESGFRIIAPHGLLSPLIFDQQKREEMLRLAYNHNLPIAVDLWPPIPEDECIRLRPDYDQMLQAFRVARTIVLDGYSFGSGDDAISALTAARVAGK